MSRIGMLEEGTNDGVKEFWGYVRTLEIDLTIRLVPNNDRRTPASPDFVILARNLAGREVEVGMAWKRVSNSQDTAGDEFLGITIDDPGFDHPINIAAFPSGDANKWDIRWRRRRAQDDKDAA